MDQGRPSRPQRDPLIAIVEPALKVGVACGSVGFLFGGAAGIIRGVSPFLFATASSIQIFALSSTFTGVRVGILRAWTSEGQVSPPSDLIKASTLAGCISGGTFSAITGYLARKRANPLPGAIMFTLFGAVGQQLYNTWSVPKPSIPTQETAFWRRMGQKSWVPFKHMTNEEYAELLREKMMKVEVEISILDDKIAALRKDQSTTKSGESEV